jgi:hypothetical protein
MGEETVWARVVLVGVDRRAFSLVLVGEDAPSLSVIDALARLQLQVRRAGGQLYLEDVSPALSGLLELAGLVGQVGGQAECRKGLPGIQKGVDSSNPTA